LGNDRDVPELGDARFESRGLLIKCQA